MARKIIITGDRSPTVLEESKGATYHSRHGALTESRHIFIENGLNFVLPRFLNEINILEVGWGTGLNSFLTFQALKDQPRRVHYIAVENDSLETELVLELTSGYGRDIEEQKQFIAQHIIEWNRPFEIQNDFLFEKRNEDFTFFVESMPVHLVYYDAFAPAVSPEMWTKEIFEKLHRTMVPGAALVTFCASGAFKRTLRSVGFVVESLPGPPGKLEITRAIR